MERSSDRQIGRLCSFGAAVSKAFQTMTKSLLSSSQSATSIKWLLTQGLAFGLVCEISIH